MHKASKRVSETNDFNIKTVEISKADFWVKLSSLSHISELPQWLFKHLFEKSSAHILLDSALTIKIYTQIYLCFRKIESVIFLVEWFDNLWLLSGKKNWVLSGS